MKTNHSPRLEGITIDNLQNKKKIFLSILDIDGNLVSKSYCDETRIQLNSSNLESGTYYWKAQFDNTEIASGKFVIQG